MKPLSYFLEKYGPDFLKKLPLYKTATRNGTPVALLGSHPTSLMALVQVLGESQPVYCHIQELDNFVL